MQLTLSKNTIPINHTARTMTDPIVITGFLRDGFDIFNPDIEVEYNAAYLQKNYAYIPEYGRYYYYSDPPTIEGKKMKEIDKSRADLRKMLADTAWGDRNGYHLMVNTSGKEIKSLVPGLAEYAKAYFSD